jgi:hypothetical protein
VLLTDPQIMTHSSVSEGTSRRRSVNSRGVIFAMSSANGLPLDLRCLEHKEFRSHNVFVLAYVWQLRCIKL